MATQKVTEKIIEDAKKEAKKLLDEYKKEAQKLKKEYTERIEKKRTEIEQELENLKKTEIMKTLAQKRMAFKKDFIEQKQKFIKEVLDQGLKELPRHKKYLDFLKELIKKGEENEGELFLSPQDMKAYGTQLEQFIKKQGRDYTLKTDEIGGGVVIKRAKKTYLGSLEIITELLQNELSIEVAKVLFKGAIDAG